jgi:hypothetical protein
MANRGKGSSYEREMSRAFSEWWTDGKRDDVFWRASQSGGRATMRGRKGKRTFGHYGDLTACDPIGQPLMQACTIELKRGYKHNTFADLLDRTVANGQQEWEKFVEQAEISHKLAGSFSWMLIQRRDKRSSVVFMPRDLWEALKLAPFKLRRPFPYFVSMKLKLQVADTRGIVKQQICAVRLGDMFRCLTPDHFRHVAQLCDKQN